MEEVSTAEEAEWGPVAHAVIAVVGVIVICSFVIGTFVLLMTLSSHHKRAGSVTGPDSASLISMFDQWREQVDSPGSGQ